MAENLQTTHGGWSSLRAGLTALALEAGGTAVIGVGMTGRLGPGFVGVTGFIALIAGTLIGVLGLSDRGGSRAERRNSGQTLCMIAVISPIAATVLLFAASSEPG